METQGFTIGLLMSSRFSWIWGFFRDSWSQHHKERCGIELIWYKKPCTLGPVVLYQILQDYGQLEYRLVPAHSGVGNLSRHACKAMWRCTGVEGNWGTLFLPWKTRDVPREDTVLILNLWFIQISLAELIFPLQANGQRVPSSGDLGHFQLELFGVEKLWQRLVESSPQEPTKNRDFFTNPQGCYCSNALLNLPHWT